MKAIKSDIPGVVIIEPKVFGDARGFFFETYSAERYGAAGIPIPFVQDNLSYSAKGVLRGLHFQRPRTQGKLVYVLEGEVFDVCVDIRRGSPTFGRSFSVILSADNKRQLYVPPGLAHGFCVTSEKALFSYKCTDYYAPQHDNSVLWNDPQLEINWPLQDVSLSDKDKKGRLLKDFRPDELPEFTV